MPFIKITSGENKGKYKIPSGIIFTAEQVKLCYVNGGKFTEEKKS